MRSHKRHDVSTYMRPKLDVATTSNVGWESLFHVKINSCINHSSRGICLFCNIYRFLLKEAFSSISFFFFLNLWTRACSNAHIDLPGGGKGRVLEVVLPEQNKWIAWMDGFSWLDWSYEDALYRRCFTTTIAFWKHIIKTHASFKFMFLAIKNILQVLNG